MIFDTLRIIKMIGAIVAVCLALYSLLATKGSSHRKQMILILWMIVPPIFFYFEYFFQAPHLNPAELARFKDLQDLARSIWAGVATALAVVYFKKG